MKNLESIRADLKEIRYYYLRKDIFDSAIKIVGSNHILEKVMAYNDAVRCAPPAIYDLYVGLYVNGFSQEALAEEMGYTPAYIQMRHKKLLLFLQSKLKD